MTGKARVGHNHPPMSGLGLPIGVGAGIVVGVFAGGGLALAIALCVGAWLGVVVDAVVVDRRR